MECILTLVLLLTISSISASDEYECNPPNTACEEIWKPVCGRRGVQPHAEFKTYSNRCELLGEPCTEGFRLYYEGEC